MENHRKIKRRIDMSRLIVVTTPILLGNSAGGLGALIGLIGYGIILVTCIGVIYGIVKWLT